jgi:hypothetical protein
MLREATTLVQDADGSVQFTLEGAIEVAVAMHAGPRC